ncbi:MAG: hypothetical protein FD130_405, partial [Halothiobacillaceae bacterium]
MKKYSLFRVVAVITLLFTTPLCADNGQRTADEILELTGVNAQIVEIASLARNEVESRKELLPLEEYQRLLQLFSTTYDAKPLHHHVVTHFAQQLDTVKANAWLSQLRSPLFSKLLQLEKETASEKSLDKII